MDLIKQLQKQAPSSWSKFEKWYFKLNQKWCKNCYNERDRRMVIETFCGMRFEFQFGVFLKFLEENNINYLIEYNTLPDPDWKKAILNSFKELQQ
jgi:hypothetical protein